MRNELLTDLTKDILSQKDQLQEMFSFQGIENQFSSARQISDASKTFQHIQSAVNQEKHLRNKSVNAQIESVKILSNQREELEMMKDAINALLEHSLEQSKQQTIALHERDKVESERYIENTRLSKIAAWAGVFSAILAAASIMIQMFS